jgi:hypothetical protein
MVFEQLHSRLLKCFEYFNNLLRFPLRPSPSKYRFLALALSAASLLSAQAVGPAAARSPAGAALVFPFGDSLYAFPGAKGGPERLLRLQGSALSRCYEAAGARKLVVADTKGERVLELAAGSEPRQLYSGAWSWAGAGAGLVAAASREYRGGFEFSLVKLGDRPGSRIEGGARLDCFVSDSLFLPGRAIVAGASGDGKSFGVWELAPDGEAGARKLFSLPREGGFLRLAGGAEVGLYCFESSRSGDSAGRLTIWKLPTEAGPGATAAARPIEPSFLPGEALAWFGSGYLAEDGSLELPLSLAGGKYALSVVDPRTGAERARLPLDAPLYQRLGSAKGVDYAILYDHARAPGKFSFAAIELKKNRITRWDLP